MMESRTGCFFFLAFFLQLRSVDRVLESVGCMACSSRHLLHEEEGQKPVVAVLVLESTFCNTRKKTFKDAKSDWPHPSGCTSDV